MSKTHKVSWIAGDGIGPEVMVSARRVIDAAGVSIEWESCEAGAKVFRAGDPTGVPKETIDSIARTRVVLKGPLETPVGYGEKSANVTIRKLFEMFGNIRPIREMPEVPTAFSGRGIDLVIVRENVEDVYAGIEHMQTPGVAQCLKLMSRKGCEKIIRLAFELARAEGRKSLHCATKANIMKMTEGMLKKAFEDISVEYPDIAARHVIIDNAAHQLVRHPEQFEMIVTSNMNGDILSDLTSGLIGGLGFAPGANIGAEIAMFEAVHGSAPPLAGKFVANPTAVILSAVMMLRHLGELEAALTIEKAVQKTYEDGIHTIDVSTDTAVGTVAFTDAVVERLGQEPRDWHGREYKQLKVPQVAPDFDFVKCDSQRTAGVDIFVESAVPATQLGGELEAMAESSELRLKMISNRGTRVYPPTGGMTDCIDQWRCRFVMRDETAELRDEVIIQMLQRISEKYRWMHIEKLMIYGGALGYTKAQGED